MGRVGGDQDDGTVLVLKCPYCRDPEVTFYDVETMVSHLVRHEGHTRTPKEIEE